MGSRGLHHQQAHAYAQACVVAMYMSVISPCFVLMQGGQGVHLPWNDSRPCN